MDPREVGAMLASSFMDPVLGIDVHFEMVPTPAPVPTPIPNPFTGIVFDPVGLACGLALGAAIGAVLGAPFQGPVLYWTAFPATNTGTEAKHVPGHILIPPGVSWAPFPKTPKPVIHPGETPTPALPVVPENDAIVIFGSKTVKVMGSNAVRLGDIALSCSEPLRLPSSVVLAVPKGAPILIGGPPSLDLLAALMASLRTRFVSDSLHALVSRLKPSRFRNLLHKGVCFLTGHPVDVASGRVLTDQIEAELPGPLPLVIERSYSSASSGRAGPLGYGWSLSVDQAIWTERGKVVVLAEDGREIEFDTHDVPGRRLEPGQRVYNPIERLTLHCEHGGRWRVVDPRGGCREFAQVPGRSDGRAMIQRQRSSCGYHEHRYHYGAQGRLEWVEDSSGRAVGLRYDEVGHVVELELPAPNGGDERVCHRRYRYDAAGDLVEVQDALGHSWRLAYVGHLLTQETDRNGLSFYFSYDGIGEDAWCVRTWGDGGLYDHVLRYDKQNHVSYVTNSLGATAQYHMNVAGLVVKTVDALGGEISYAYDPVSLQLVAELDALGQRRTWAYDERGNLVELRGPDAAVQTRVYDSRNRLVGAVDAVGGEWTWTYDERGRRVSQAASDGGVRRAVFHGGFLVAEIDELGHTTRYGYSPHGQLDAMREANGATTRWRYDRRGRVVAVEDPRGNSRSRGLDLEGRALLVETEAGERRSLARDPEGNIVQLRDDQVELELSYCGLGRVRTRTQDGVSLSFEYDSEEQLCALVNGQGHRYRFEHDERGEVVGEWGFDGAERSYTRDAAGQVVELRRGAGRGAKQVYDGAGRLVEVKHSDGTTLGFRYRADGELVEAWTGDVCLAFERDVIGRVVRERCGPHWVESSYDARGARIELRSSFGARQEVERNELGDVVAMRYRDAARHDGPGDFDRQRIRWEVGIERDATGLELARTLPGGVRSSWARDGLGRPVHHRLADGRGERARDLRLEWGRYSQLERLVDLARGQTTLLGHDNFGALTWSETDGTALLRMPDAVGNLFRRQDRQDRRYGPAGELLEQATEAGARRYVYDLDGNLVEKREPDGGVWRYTWNGAGQLVAVERPDRKRVEFQYDALGRRLAKRSDGRVTRWIWDRDRPLHEWSEADEGAPLVLERPDGLVEVLGLDGERLAELGAGHPTRGPPPSPTVPRALVTWLFELGTFAPVAKIVDDRRYSIVCDHLDAPVAMLDEHGAVVWSAEPDAYGELRELACADGQARDAVPFRRAGQYEDAETGLYYNRHRYYDPDAGQYISQDPIGLLGGLALYAYVDDPFGAFDPLGLAGPYSLYHITDSGGNVVYVGISNNPTRRSTQHLGTGRLDSNHTFTVVENNLSEFEVRGYEQADIRHYGTRDTGRIGEPFQGGEPNRCWSYAVDRTDARATQFKVHEAERTRQHQQGCSS